MIAQSEDLQRTALRMCRDDVAMWARQWVWIYEPRNASKGLPTTIPFDPFEMQIGLFDFLDERLQNSESGLTEKSRDMGFSWAVMIWMVHQWLFMPGFAGGVTSYKDKFVDKLGDMFALLPKAAFILDCLPDWMLPRMADGTVWRSKNKQCRKLNLIIHPGGGALIGEVGSDVGRAGRLSCMLVDEHAKLAYAESIEASLSNTTDVVIYGSSARGAGNLFYRKRMSGEVPVYRMHWTQDPRKDEKWYKRQVKRFKSTPWVVKQEIDIDYSAGVRGIAIPGDWLESCTRWTPPEHEPGTHAIAGYDPSDGGGDSHGLVIRRGVRLGILTDEWFEGTAGEGAIETDLILRQWSDDDDATCDMIVYDGIGIGTACSAYFVQTPLDAYNFKAGSRASEDLWHDRPAHDLFANAKAEAWWRLRERARKTYENSIGISDHHWTQCLWIHPDAHEMRLQLSTPKAEQTSDGKLRIESKKKMSARGVSSPGLADAAVMTFAADLSSPLGGPSFNVSDMFALL